MGGVEGGAGADATALLLDGPAFGLIERYRADPSTVRVVNLQSQAMAKLGPEALDGEIARRVAGLPHLLLASHSAPPPCGAAPRGPRPGGGPPVAGRACVPGGGTGGAADQPGAVLPAARTTRRRRLPRAGRPGGCAGAGGPDSAGPDGGGADSRCSGRGACRGRAAGRPEVDRRLSDRK